MQTEYFKLDILSPVHIGTGDELDPMNYLMREEDGEAACHVFDTQAWASDYSDPDEFSEVFSGSNIPAMRGFLANKIDPDIYGKRRITVSNRRIFQEYKQKLPDRRSIHQLLFSPHMTTSECVPLIPGSSIKGALRTAVIDRLDREKRLGLKAARAKDKRGDAYRKRLESVLGPTTDSAFKHLKISDVTGYADSTLLVEPHEVRRKEGKAATPKNKCEVMPSLMLGEAEKSKLHARIGIGSSIKPSDGRLILADGQGWNWFELANLVNSYFLKRFLEEKSKFYGLPSFAKSRPNYEKLEAELQCDNGQMILRLGHYSQVEFVTIKDNKPLTRMVKGARMPYGTTRTLANGLFPFGWIRSPCSEIEYLKGMADCEASNRVSQEHREANREKVLSDRIRQLEKIRQREEAARQQAEAEARRQAELDALPEEERQLFLLERGELQEQEVVALYNQLEVMEEQLQLRTARALKDYWQKVGKWDKKHCSKKQKIKVNRVKEILKEA